MQKLTRAQILDLRKLFQRSERYSRKEYLIEGEKVIQEAVLSGVIIKKLIVTEEFLVSGKDYLASLGVSENSYGVVPEESMQQLSGMVTAPGVMAVVAMITFLWKMFKKRK